MTPTQPQYRILIALDAARLKSHPWLPTLEMVATIAKLKSRSAVTYHLPSLEEAGWVEVGPHRRGLRLTTTGRRAVRLARTS